MRRNCTISRNEDLNWSIKKEIEEYTRFLMESVDVELFNSKKIIKFNDQYLIDANEHLVSYSCIIKK